MLKNGKGTAKGEMKQGFLLSPRKLLTVVVLASLLLGLVIYDRLSQRYTQIHIPASSLYKRIFQSVQEFQPMHKLTHFTNISWVGNPLINSSEPKVKRRVGLTVVGNNTFYIYTAVAQQPKNAPMYDKLYITGWEVKSAQNKKYLCCFVFSNGTVGTSSSSYKFGWGGNDALKSRQVVCDISSINVEETPKSASLSPLNENCDHRQEFHEIEYIRPVTTPSFAICGKISYGKKDPRYLIEWLEYHKYMGVAKIVIYTYADLHEPARRVLKHYVDEGILEAVPMPFAPKLDRFPRHFAVQNSSIMWQDEKVPLFDVEQRLRPYSYLGVIDTDEFIVPKHPGVENFVDLMVYLLRTYEKGGTFQMQSEIHIMDWAKTNNDSDLMIEQYGNRTQSMTETPKFLMVNDRIKEGSIWIHRTQPKQGFSLIVPKADDEVVLKHFRKCKRGWLVAGKDGVPNKCHSGFQRHRDTLMERVAEKIGPNIRRVKSLLQL